jgi:HEXXH motif-containing protein
MEGKIAIRPDVTIVFAPDCIEADPSHPNIAKGEALLAHWPEVYSQLQQLVDSVSIFFYTPHPFDLITGSICGPGGDGFGTIATTINHHVGFAEALVHEMAHHKLRVLGVHFEKAEGLITNPQETTYPSPIRYDCLRPMTAVLHAQYSYTYVSALDIHIVKNDADEERIRQIVAGSLAWNLPKLEFGLAVLRKHAQVDASGDDFMAGFYDWSDWVLQQGYMLLQQFQVVPQQFAHPLL